MLMIIIAHMVEFFLNSNESHLRQYIIFIYFHGFIIHTESGKW